MPDKTVLPEDRAAKFEALRKQYSIGLQFYVLDPMPDGRSREEHELIRDAAAFAAKATELPNYRDSFSLDADFEDWFDSASPPLAARNASVWEWMRKAFDAGAMVEHERKQTGQLDGRPRAKRADELRKYIEQGCNAIGQWDSRTKASLALDWLDITNDPGPEVIQQPNDEPMSAFVRRAERYAADYTDLGEGYEREKRMDFFLRGALWMRKDTARQHDEMREQFAPADEGYIIKQSEHHPCPECGKPMESLLVWRCACGCFGGEQSKDVPEAVESAGSPAGVDSGSGSSPRAEAGTSAGTDYDALCDEAEQYGMTLPFNAAGRVVHKLAAAIRELRAEQAKDDAWCDCGKYDWRHLRNVHKDDAEMERLRMIERRVRAAFNFEEISTKTKRYILFGEGADGE